MSDTEDTAASEKQIDQKIVKFIFDLSKEMNIEDTRGVVGNELELIALVRNCRFLYDKNLSDFKDVRKKNVAWGAIASVMHSTVHEVQQRWRSLREGYNKYKKEMECTEEVTSGTVRPWEFYEDMKFIDPYIVHRRASGLNFPIDTEILKNESTDASSSDRNPDILQLIACIKVRPVLYDSKHIHYKSRESKIQAWNEVAQNMNATANECEQKWKNLRERYGRERKLKGSNSDKKTWEYFNALQFLDTHIKPRRHSIFRPILPKLEDSTNNLTILNALHTPITTNNQQTIILKQLIKDISEPVQDVEVSTENAELKLNTSFDCQHVEFVDASNAITSRSSSVTPTPSEAKLNVKGSYLSPSSDQSQLSHDEDELFGQTITAELRRMPSGKKKMKIKAEIYKILYENESDN